MTLSRLFAYRPAALAAVGAEYLATLVHHLYGGLVFGTPERLVMAAIFTGMLAPTLVLHALAASQAWARVAAVLLGLAFWGGMLGGFEGAHNHVYASLLNLLGEPPAGYQPDLFFQATGWLTFLFGAAAVWAYLRPAPTGVSGGR